MAAAASSFPPLKLLKATYGYTESKKIDVLHKLEKMVAEHPAGCLVLEQKQDLNMLFSDPEPKTSKKLTITYQYGATGDVLVDEYPETRDRTVTYEAQDKPTDKMFGQLTLTVHRAADLKDVESFGRKMDPYYTLTCGTEKFTSKVADKGHCNPEFEQQHVLNLDGTEDLAHFTFWDKNTLSDAAIGRCDVPLGVLAQHDTAQWVTVNEMTNFNKLAGKFLVTASFKGRGGPRPPSKKAAAAAAAAAATATAAAPQVVYVATPVLAVPVKPTEGPACRCDKGHAMTWHEDGDRCAYTCTGCGAAKSGTAGAHYQCATCQLYWLCSGCAAQAVATKWSPSAPLAAPLCDKGHAATDYTGRKPVGYHNEYKCDVCAKQHAFGQVVKYWHCDPCQWDCCVPCGDKYVKAGRAPAFKAGVTCTKGHGCVPGWNTIPAAAAAKGQATYACSVCKGKNKRYAPAQDYYACWACAPTPTPYVVCPSCVEGAAKTAAAKTTATAAAPAAATKAAAAKK